MVVAMAAAMVMEATAAVTAVMTKMITAAAVVAAWTMVATATAGGDGHRQQLPAFTSSSIGCCILC